MTENKTLATVNEVCLTESDVEAVLHRIGPQRAAQYNTPQGRQQILQDLITQQLLLAEAKETGLDTDQDFLQQLDKVKDDVLIQYAVQKLMSSVVVSPDEVKAYYEAHKEQFETSESIKASHILVENEESANEVLEKINEGMSFEQAANTYSKCQSEQNGGDLGYFTRGKMVQEFEDAAFAMQIGEISQPVTTQFGCHIIKLVDRKAAEPATFADVKERLTQQLTETKRSETYHQTSKVLSEKYSVVVNS